ncbi:energy transducer TonB [Dechloromonas sp. XY25]|uniref:Energy transducer TonB n=1 Tax=Dechloromonas hankyongensis TaxID=2908002 RepID=A0ABS9K5H6_9RHOO|nr:energy transducer TonB [Dechloromonas hankyongensis]MCG2578413.1 energy transducer TonB [Dechloromonas hankyongensis]
MIRADFRLFAALALSLCLHGLPVLPEMLAATRRPPPAPPIQATLRTLPPPTAAPSPPLLLPEPPPRHSEPPKPHRQPTPAPAGPKTWTQVVREQLKKLDAAGQFYPPEAIARGLEGEALVLLIIDESGQVVATRLEQGSGHPILDDAALRAARSLKSLPADAPRQTVLPVRFRLK